MHKIIKDTGLEQGLLGGQAPDARSAFAKRRQLGEARAVVPLVALGGCHATLACKPQRGAYSRRAR